MVERQHQAASVMGFWVGPVVTNERLDVSWFLCLSLHDADIDKTFSSQPPPVFSLSYTILVNALFTDGCFSLSTPSGMNDLDIGTS